MQPSPTGGKVSTSKCPSRSRIPVAGCIARRERSPIGAVASSRASLHPRSDSDFHVHTRRYDALHLGAGSAAEDELARSITCSGAGTSLVTRDSSTSRDDEPPHS
jgi:hypothetical protein